MCSATRTTARGFHFTIDQDTGQKIDCHVQEKHWCSETTQYLEDVIAISVREVKNAENWDTNLFLDIVQKSARQAPSNSTSILVSVTPTNAREGKAHELYVQLNALLTPFQQLSKRKDRNIHAERVLSRRKQEQILAQERKVTEDL